MCERARGGQVLRYDSEFPSVQEAGRVSRSHYEAGDAFAWLWKNESTGLNFTEEARAGGRGPASLPVCGVRRRRG